jgi:hypothetical protein
MNTATIYKFYEAGISVPFLDEQQSKILKYKCLFCHDNQILTKNTNEPVYIKACKGTTSNLIAHIKQISHASAYNEYLKLNENSPQVAKKRRYDSMIGEQHHLSYTPKNEYRTFKSEPETFPDDDNNNSSINSSPEEFKIKKHFTIIMDRVRKEVDLTPSKIFDEEIQKLQQEPFNVSKEAIEEYTYKYSYYKPCFDSIRSKSRELSNFPDSLLGDQETSDSNQNASSDFSFPNETEGRLSIENINSEPTESANSTTSNANSQVSRMSNNKRIKQSSIQMLENEIRACSNELTSSSSVKNKIELCDMIKAASEAILALKRI